MRPWKLTRLLLPVALFAAVLAGCATPGPALVGADRTAVQSKIGSPAYTHPLPGGGERWFYPVGSLQQQVWGVDIDAAGRVTQVRQLHTAENFARIRVGTDTQDDILREFGRPRMTQPYRLSNEVGWMYPYLESGFVNSEMVVLFDPQGIVRRIESGPDPRFLGNGDRR
jgi:outer membrane protein assembly factor BamE (lipoprotein component of BamABCDE complex)